MVFAQENGSPCQDISVGWPAAFALLRECWREGGTALIHCKAGLNRSVTTAAVFLVLHGLAPSWDAAIELIRAKRPAVNWGNEDPVTHARIPAPHRHWYEQFGAAFIAANAAKPVSFLALAARLFFVFLRTNLFAARPQMYRDASARL